MDVSRLRGRWLILAEAYAIVPISLARDAARAVQDTPTPRQDPVSELEADGAKIISLGRYVCKLKRQQVEERLQDERPRSIAA